MKISRRSIAILKRLIRDEFDRTPPQDYSTSDELIRMADELGLEDLAQEMSNDLELEVV